MTDPNEPTSQVDSGLVAFLETITVWILTIGGLAFLGGLGYIFFNYVLIIVSELNK